MTATPLCREVSEGQESMVRIDSKNVDYKKYSESKKLSRGTSYVVKLN